MKVSEQCVIAAAKRNQILGLIRRNIAYKEKELIILQYKTIVRPHLEYCIQAWRPYHKKDIHMLERVQSKEYLKLFYFIYVFLFFIFYCVPICQMLSSCF